MIHDVSTDADDPPQFVALRDTRLACKNGVDYSGPRSFDHRQRYPDIKPAVFRQSPEVVYESSLEAILMLNWAVAAAVEAEGRIEATATTRLLRFKDDVVIRIRAQSDGSGTRLDIRSASRVGSSDFGVNAKRIHTFLLELNNRLKIYT